MTDPQWTTLLRVLNGERLNPLPVALLVDCPWFSYRAGTGHMDYFTDDAVWLEANLTACAEFPDVMLVPGFWAEYGMSTNPSAFGCKCVWPEDQFPFPEKILEGCEQIPDIRKPNCRTDGL